MTTNQGAQGRFQIKDGRFLLDGQPFRFVGVNLRELAYYGYAAWEIGKYTKRDDIGVQLRAAREMKAQVVRLYAPYHKGIEKNDTDYDQTIQRLRSVLDQCQQHDLFALITLDDAKDSGFHVSSGRDFDSEYRPSRYYGLKYYEQGYRKIFLPFIQKVLTDLKGHPALFAWGVCNEAQVFPHVAHQHEMQRVSDVFLDFFKEVTATMRQTDPYTLITPSIETARHLFVEYAYDRGDYATRLYQLPTIDFATVHTYRDCQGDFNNILGHNAAYLPVEARLAQSVWKKPIIVEEIGPCGGKNRANGGEWLAKALPKLFDLGFSGVLQWGFSAADGDIGVGDRDSGMHKGGDSLPTADWQKMFEVYQGWGNQFWKTRIDQTGLADEMRQTDLRIATPSTVSMDVVLNVRIRTAPRLAEDTKKGWLNAGTTLEVISNSRLEAEGCIWWQHAEGWSVEKDATGTTYLLETLPSSAMLQVVTVGGMLIREKPNPKARMMGGLPENERFSPISAQRTIAEGYVWVQHPQGWVAQIKIQGGEVFLKVIKTALPPVIETVKEEVIKNLPIAEEEKNEIPPVEVKPVPRKTIPMKVIKRVRLRHEPRLVAETFLRWLEEGTRLEVFEDSRLQDSNGYIWWQHQDGWTAEIADGTYLVRTDGITPQPSDNPDYGSGYLNLIQQLPVSLKEMQWFQYFGNTMFAYHCGGNFNYKGYSQGLHGGLDLGSDQNITVRAGVQGIYQSRETPEADSRGRANHKVYIKSGAYTLIYQHVWQEFNLAVGTIVEPSTPLATIRPNAQGGLNHLHFEIRYKDKILNPLLLMSRELADQVVQRFPATGHRAFFQRHGKWLSPYDQPLLQLGGSVLVPNYPDYDSNHSPYPCS